MRLIALSSRFAGSPTTSPACSAMSAAACAGPRAARKNWLMVPRLMGRG